MSTLVIWSETVPPSLSKGWIPIGLAKEDFENVDAQSVANSFIGEYLGDPTKIHLYNMTEYSYPEPKIYHQGNISITVDGNPAIGLGDTFYGDTNVDVVIQADILDSEDNIVTEIDQVTLGYPPVLKMPIVKMLGGISGTEIDEIYFNVSLTEGVLTASGVIPTSGDWKILSERLNKAIKAVNGDWEVESFTINILV